MLQVVSVTFNELSLETRCGGCYDSVSLYDGPSYDSDLLAELCKPPEGGMPTFTSSGPSILVVFKTDGSIHEGGFSLNWNFVSKDDPGLFIRDILLTNSCIVNLHNKLSFCLDNTTAVEL